MNRREAGNVGCYTAVFLAIATAALVWVVAVEVVGLSVYAPWRANKVTEVTRNTNQYVETQQQEIFGEVRQYDVLAGYEQTEEIDRQQQNLVYQMCEAASKIDRQYVPESAVSIMNKEGC